MIIIFYFSFFFFCIVQWSFLQETLTEDNIQCRQDEFVETLSSNMKTLCTQPEELPQAISSHIRNCLQVTWVVSATAGDVSNIVSVMLLGWQKEDCQPNNITETISETSPALTLTTWVTSRQFLIWLDIACGNSSSLVYNASILLYNVSTNSYWQHCILSSVKVSWKNDHWTKQK